MLSFLRRLELRVFKVLDPCLRRNDGLLGIFLVGLDLKYSKQALVALITMGLTVYFTV